MKLIEPVPEWEETPTKQEGGYWAGRFRYLRQGCNGEPEVDVDVCERVPPEDMADAEPIEIDGKWYWNRRPEGEGK